MSSAKRKLARKNQTSASSTIEKISKLAGSLESELKKAIPQASSELTQLKELVSGLQETVDALVSDNEALNTEITQLKDDVESIKHKLGIDK